MVAPKLKQAQPFFPFFSLLEQLLSFSPLPLFCVTPHVSNTLAALIRRGRGFVAVSDFTARSRSTELDRRSCLDRYTAQRGFSVPFDARGTGRCIGPVGLSFSFSFFKYTGWKDSGLSTAFTRTWRVARWSGDPIFAAETQKRVFVGWIWILAWICKNLILLGTHQHPSRVCGGTTGAPAGASISCM